MKITRLTAALSIMISLSIIFCTGCQNAEMEMESLMATIDSFETAWSEGDFLKVDTFFAGDAKRLHTEPDVWDREAITKWCEEQASKVAENTEPVVKTNWKEGRNYLDIRIEGNIAYDVFTTSTFKVIHIWEKQKDGSWKILFDMGILNQPEEE